VTLMMDPEEKLIDIQVEEEEEEEEDLLMNGTHHYHNEVDSTMSLLLNKSKAIRNTSMGYK
jgi:hypothetical protein